MFCIDCKTKFNYNTLEIFKDSDLFHNPHEDELRRRIGIVRAANNPCENVLSFMNKKHNRFIDDSFGMYRHYSTRNFMLNMPTIQGFIIRKTVFKYRIRIKEFTYHLTLFYRKVIRKFALICQVSNREMVISNHE